MDVAQLNRNKTKCYWESQPTGCKKPHCPFLHDKPKEPYPEAVTQILENPAPTQNIIVNRNKIAELSGLILPVKPGLATAAVRANIPDGGEDSADTGRKVIVPQRSSSSSVKSRLGPRRIAAKERLGERYGESHDNVEVFECSDEEDNALNSEEEALRSSAMKTLDLRNRLTSRRVREVDSGEELVDEEFSADDMEPKETEGLRSTVVKKSKKEKKERKVKEKKAAKKAKKADKKMRKGKRSSLDIGARALLSIKEEAERLVNSKKFVDKDYRGEEEVKSIIIGKKNLENIKVRLNIKDDSPSPSPSPPPPSSRARKRRANVGDDEEATKSKSVKKSAKAKKRKTSEKLPKSEKKVKKKAAVETEVDEIDRLLNEEGEGSTTAATTTETKSNDATDVIKEMDDLLNDV